MQIALSPNRRLYIVFYDKKLSGDEHMVEKKFNANQAAGLMQLVKSVHLKINLRQFPIGEGFLQLYLDIFVKASTIINLSILILKLSLIILALPLI